MTGVTRMPQLVTGSPSVATVIEVRCDRVYLKGVLWALLHL